MVISSFPRYGSQSQNQQKASRNHQSQSDPQLVALDIAQDVEVPRNFALNDEELQLMSAVLDDESPDMYGGREGIGGMIMKGIMAVLVVLPWKFIRGVAWILNKWQRILKPLGGAVYYLFDKSDKYMPTVHYFCKWLYCSLSLALHFISIALVWAICDLLLKNKHPILAYSLLGLICLNHYLMAVIMYMEMDRITSSSRYSFNDLRIFIWRLFDVLFWDTQLFASVVHSNSMIEGTTQMMLKGYEEARIALFALCDTIPACVILGLIYDGAYLQWPTTFDLNSYQQQLWVALCISVLNAVEKWLRMSIADPIMHTGNDGYPILYMRCNAASIPTQLIKEWLYHCNGTLAACDNTLRLKDMYAKFMFASKGDVRELSDGHKAYLLKKALRTFNGTARYNRAERVARRMHMERFRRTHSIKKLLLDELNPGPYLAEMIAEVLGDTHGFDLLNLSNNALGDDLTVAICEELMRNQQLDLTFLDLSFNSINEDGATAVAAYVNGARQLFTLNLSNNPITDNGIKALSESLKSQATVMELNLSSCQVGHEGAGALAQMLKVNTTLKTLILCGSKIGSGGVEAICKCLRNNRGLKELDLSRTPIDNQAGLALAAMLTSNRSLQKLNISGTKIGDVGAKALSEALNTNETLKVLDVSGCTMDGSYKRLLNNIMTGRHK